MHIATRRLSAATAFSVGLLLAFGYCGEAPAEIELPPLSPELRQIFDGQTPRDVGQLREMQRYQQQLARKAIACVVSVQVGPAHGSGVIVTPKGHVLTAAHVAGSPGRRVLLETADGRRVMGRSLGMHMELDAAVIKIAGEGPWEYLRMGPSEGLRKGQWAAALGHPRGIDRDRGPVFRMGRILSLGHLIRTDCQLVGGDSGGPLVNMDGEVIGIHSRIGTSLSNNLHVPVTAYRDRWDDLLAGKIWSSRAYIGVLGNKDSPDALVDRVRPDSPAQRAGVIAGDTITDFAGQPIETFAELVDLVQQRTPGERVSVGVRRGDERLQLDIVIGQRDAS